MMGFIRKLIMLFKTRRVSRNLYSAFQQMLNLSLTERQQAIRETAEALTVGRSSDELNDLLVMLRDFRAKLG